MIREAKRRWRAHRVAAEGGPMVAISASFTAEPLVPFLGAELLDRSVPVSALSVAPYGQIFQTCFDPRAAFGDREPDAIVLLWRIEDLFPELLERLRAGDPTALRETLGEISGLQQAVGALRDSFAGTIVVGTPPFPNAPGIDLRDLRNALALGADHRRMVDHWVQGIDAVARVQIFDFDALQRHHGADRALDERKWHLYRQPYTDAFWALVGEDLARILAAQRGAARKCVVVDCDNTLWGGIIGEDGLGGIQIGQDFPGSAYRDFQRALTAERENGVLLALASKNNEPDVWEVFDRHDGMLLRRDHLSAWRINWRPKAENLRDIAAELGIGTESLVFVDDNPVEIAEVQATLPEVACLQVPEDPARLPSTFREARLFDRIDLTAEDRRRAAMMEQERDRRDLQTRLSPTEFLASLDLRVSVFRVRAEHVARVVQLINKTNQFNLTTVRRSRDQVETLMGSQDHHLMALRVQDRFGDYGLVGVSIAREESDVWILDTLLMSCRVLGRGVQTAFLAGIAAEARGHKMERIRGSYVATPKNGLVAGLYADHGFEPVDDDCWEAAIESIPGRPEHISKV